MGSLVSKAMCSNLCACDISNIPASVREEWLAVKSDQAILDKFDRCIPEPIDLTNPFVEVEDDCDREKAIVMYDGSPEQVLLF